MNALGMFGLHAIEASPKGFIVRGAYGELYQASPARTKRIITQNIKYGFISQGNNGIHKGNSHKSKSAFVPTVPNPCPPTPKYVMDSLILDAYLKKNPNQLLGTDADINESIPETVPFKAITNSVALAYRMLTKEDIHLIMEITISKKAHFCRFDNPLYESLVLNDDDIRWG